MPRNRRSRSSSWTGANNGNSSSSSSNGGSSPQGGAAQQPQSNSSVGSGGNSANGSTFPRKLSEMLENEPDVIAWSQHGLSFFICDTDALTHQLLPKYFRHNKLTSFQRQLNLYGFRRITKGADVGAYFHPQFRKDRPDLVARIRRLPGQGATATAKFLPLYYKDVQNSCSKNGSPKAGAGATKGRGQRSESLASFTSTLSHSSSEGSLADMHEADHQSCDGDEVVGGLLGSGPAGTGGGYTGTLWSAQYQQPHSYQAYAAAQQQYYASSSAGSSCGGDDCYSDIDADGHGAYGAQPAAVGYSCYAPQQRAAVAEEDEDEEADAGCEYTFLDPAPLGAAVTTPRSCCEGMEEDGEDEQEAQQQLYSHSAPARFQRYWQPSPTGASAAAAAAPQRTISPTPIPAATLSASSIRSYTPLPMGVVEEDAKPVLVAAEASSSSMSDPPLGAQPAAAQQQPPPAAAALLPKTFSVTSFSQWLNGSCNLATAPAGEGAFTATAITATAAPAGSPPPPRPLVKRCSSMNSELWRGWASTDDLTALADMAPEEMDSIFGSFGRDTEMVLHSVGLEVASDGSLRPDATTASVAATANAVSSHLALSITAA